MGEWSKTGLLAAVQISVYHQNFRAWERINMALEDLVTTGPAPVIMRPFAGIYNPFPFRCSVLCNHPADVDVRNGLSRPPEKGDDLKSVRDHSEDVVVSKFARPSFMNAPAMTDDWVPEELFRKYTETDSKPPSPAPTLASLETIRNSSHIKRSSTAHTTKDNNKTHLVLDLRRRRSHSQETLSWREMVTPVPLLPAPMPEKRVVLAAPSPPQPRRPAPPVRKSPSRAAKEPKEPPPPPAPATPPSLVAPKVIVEPEDTALGTPRRRGVKRRSRAKSRGLSPAKDFQHLEEPGETQISKGGDDPDPVVEADLEKPPDLALPEDASEKSSSAQSPQKKVLTDRGEYRSFLTEAIIHHLQRGLDWHVIEAEFDKKRQVALIEAIRAPYLGDPVKVGGALENMPDLWVTVPRSFTRKSARFELPMDSRKLNTISPLEYARQLVQVSTGRKLLYNEIFNKHSDDSGIENEARSLQLQALPASLAEVMGQEVTPDLLSHLYHLLDLESMDQSYKLDFRTFCGVSAIAERVLGAKWKLLEPLEKDPKHLVEDADFQRLQSRIQKIANKDSVLLKLLCDINEA